MGPADFGDVPTWIGGAGALAAGWFAYQTIKSQRQQIDEQRAFIAEQTRFMDDQRQNLELERAELRAAAQDRRWAQARMVEVKTSSAGAGPYGTGDPDHWRVIVANRTDAPLHDVEVRFGTAYRADAVAEWDLGRGRAGERRVAPVPLLGPGRALIFLSQGFPPAGLDSNRPTVFFVDDSGVRWSHDWRGKLEEVPADGAS
ncbi:hypothetical protein [Streptomyces rochei]|uniref:hypothetical protein n=1 Tax=Streptomyces rochei TaxID=1928 RepID=UPI003701ABCF